jgi:hypothetical protein
VLRRGVFKKIDKAFINFEKAVAIFQVPYVKLWLVIIIIIMIMII